MKNIIGLDLGTNSIGWSLIEANDEGNPVKILKAGSRIIPMSQDILGKFNSGTSISQTAERTGYRSIRRLRERHLLRRERLHRVLHKLDFLPAHYDQSLGWDKDDNRTYGKFLADNESKLAWYTNEGGKSCFFFMDSFREMIEDFRSHHPHLLLPGKDGKLPLIPYDWTIYYLRKKGLTAPLSKEEIAWLLLHFNQKRGYYQLRGEEEEKSGKREEYQLLKVVHVEKTESAKKGDDEYIITFENGWSYVKRSRTPLFDWQGTTKEYIVTTSLGQDGQPKKDKEGNIQRLFRIPKEDDWILIKKKTEMDVRTSGKTVGAYIYDTLLSHPNQKIKGGLVRTIERHFYKSELRQILTKQQEFIPQLRDKELLAACIEELYPNNIPHQQNLKQKGFVELFVDDIIFYQRPLKTQKHLISNCPYEYHTYRKGKEEKIKPLKCISRSNPLFQEFRLWQFIHNLRIYKRQEWINGKLHTDVDVTAEFLSLEKKEALFEYLNNLGSIKQDALLKNFWKIKKNSGEEHLPYRWNYVEDKSYPCNETRFLLVSKLKKCGIEVEFLTPEMENRLWHLLYSVEDPGELKKALSSFAALFHLPEQFVEEFVKISSFKKEYGSYSGKAIKKLLAIMRVGKYWRQEEIDPHTSSRIDKIITGEADETINTLTRERTSNFASIDHFQGLPTYLACYVVYGRCSESSEVIKWNKPEEMQLYMESVFKQNCLRNPIVEQVVRETMRTVYDLWKLCGRIDEIHLELGREMKNPAAKRAAITSSITENENRNLRIKALLMELKSDAAIENVRPFSPGQQEILKIYEEGALMAAGDIPEDIFRITRIAEPRRSELQRYKLWLEQKYCSPYTGRPIPLGKLFTPAYEIEHIIPQSRYFDDSLSNKVICESGVNKLKDNLLGYEFIKKYGGQIVEGIPVFNADQYQQFIQLHYSRNKVKMKKLLMEEIPESFIQRQLNDSRYIAKVVKGLLSNIVREKDETTSDSKHVISCTGAVTSRLKKDWGLTDVWDRIIQYRFERLNQLSSSTEYGEWEGNRFRIRIPVEHQKGFEKKRVDHRHHALDAIIIACATRSHINYLSNINANEGEERSLLRNKLRRMEEIEYTILKDGEEIRKKRKVAREFLPPWVGFTKEVQTILEKLVVSFKQDLRVLGYTNNTTTYYDEEGNKRYKKQLKGDRRSIRKPLHKDTVSGGISLQEKKKVRLSVALETPKQIVDKQLRKKIAELTTLYGKYDPEQILTWFKSRKYKWNDQDIAKVEIYYFNDGYAATRKTVDTGFNRKVIESVTDSGIRKILLRHLQNHENKPELAFSPEGILDMNKRISELNGGKPRQPIYKVRVYELIGNKFPVGYTANKKDKYVEAAKGTNLYFGIYQAQDGTRTYQTVPLNEVIERLKQGEPPVPSIRINKEKEEKLLFWLSPNDLVYVPAEEERENPHLVDLTNPTKEQVNRIYKMVSSSGNQCFFIQASVATSIIDKYEFTKLNKSERAILGEMVKEVCWKLKIDRLGNIILVQR